MRIHCIFNNLDSFAADFISAGFFYLRQITECAADLIPIKSSLWQESSLSRAEVVWAARKEMARSLEDVLARRTRALFLNAEATITMAPEAARILATELQKDQVWVSQQVAGFKALAAQYLPTLVGALLQATTPNPVRY